MPAVYNDDNFEAEVLKSEKLSVVDFWAPWCGPCRKMNPILQELAVDYKDTVKFTKMNVDENRNFVIGKKIESIPTLIIYKDGKEVDRVVGLVSKEKLKKILNQYIKK